jgi:hypothetical protein
MSAQSYADSAAATEPAPSLSRRSMLRGAAGAGAAGLAAAAVASAAPALAAATSAAPTSAAPTSAAPTTKAGHSAGTAGAAEPVVVHLRDARSGEMDIFAGTSHTRLRDPDLAARLTRAVR